jgi:16S rRNA (cytidine1402-2'-O)-methyltransferase
MKGKLYLLPITLGDSSISQVIPQDVINKTIALRHFVVENIRTTRRFLRALDKSFPIDETEFLELNKHTSTKKIESYLKAIDNGNDIGVMSEAGVPGVADPGAIVVEMAHKNNIQVVPFVGPSSILMAMMASGLNGQNFAFNGYLPVKSPERIKRIKSLENRSRSENQSQLLIETPYRNNAMLEDMLKSCHPDTLICIAADISLDTEYIKTKPAKIWNKNKPDLNKRPTLFIIQA